MYHSKQYTRTNSESSKTSVFGEDILYSFVEGNLKINTRQVFVIMLFLAIFLLTLRPVTDPDFWWHLRTGQWIIQAQQVPYQDMYSYTMNGNPWITHEWLSEVLIYLAYKWGGFTLLMLLFSLIITAAYLTSYLRTDKSSRPYIAGFTLLVGAAGSNPLWGVRPQMITLLFFGLFLFFLDRFSKESKIRYLIPLPILMLFWVNFHGGFILGIGLIGAYIGGNLVELVWQRYKSHQPSQDSWRPIAALIITLFLSTATVLVNPNGVKILLYPFQTLTDPSMQQYIQEWQSPDFSQPMWILFALMILLLVHTGLRGGHTKSITQIFLVLFFLYAGLRDMRHIPLFAIVAIPIISDQLNPLITYKRSNITQTKARTWLNGALIVLTMTAVVARILQQAGNQESDVAKSYPVEAVKWIQENQPIGRIFNSYAWGGYLIWSLYPHYQVYIDGRADVYGPSFLKEYMSLLSLKPGWQEKFANNNISTVLIEPESAMANVLRGSTDWQIVYEDKTSVLFLAQK